MRRQAAPMRVACLSKGLRTSKQTRFQPLDFRLCFFGDSGALACAGARFEQCASKGHEGLAGWSRLLKCCMQAVQEPLLMLRGQYLPGLVRFVADVHLHRGIKASFVGEKPAQDVLQLQLILDWCAKRLQGELLFLQRPETQAVCTRMCFLAGGGSCAISLSAGVGL